MPSKIVRAGGFQGMTAKAGNQNSSEQAAEFLLGK
jgi:hypothetical protein